MQQVIFSLLGPPEISYTKQQLKIPRRRSRALLYYMVSTHMPQPRERLLALLCGEMDEGSARRAFKTMLAEARSQLRGIDPSIDWIISDRDQLIFNPLAPVWLDTEIFEKDAGTLSRNLSQAIKLYRGDFLDGFFLKDAPNFDDWVRSTRDHFRQLYLSALRQLAAMYEADNQLAQAITCIQMLLAVDSLSEEAHTHLMRLFWMAGDRTQALRQYEKLCSVLAEAFSIRPSAHPQALYQQIAHSSKWQAASASMSSAPLVRTKAKPPLFAPDIVRTKQAVAVPFVGRTPELAWFREHLHGPANERPFLLLQGEAGSGKTRFIQEIQKRYCPGWLILRGTCQEAERKNSYHGIVEALRHGLQSVDLTRLDLPPVWLAQIARLVPDLFHLEESWQAAVPIEPTVLADALVALFNQAALPERPLLFVLEDLQWADKRTFSVLAHLVHHVQRGNLFFLASCRRGSEKRLASLFRSAYRQDLLATLELPLMSPEDITELAAGFFSRYPSDVFSKYGGSGEWCYQRSEGNPFFALAWLTFARKELDAGRELPTAPVPDAIKTLVAGELALLSRHANALLSVAAYPGTSFQLLTAARLLDFDMCTMLAAGRELVEHAFIFEDSSAGAGCYTFAHCAVRDVVLSSSGEMQRHLFQHLVCAESQKLPATELR